MNSYCTVAEFQHHPTGLNLANLVQGGTSAAQTAELGMILALATSMVDRWCYQPLYAHSRTDTHQTRPNAYQRLAVRCRHFPVVSVSSGQWKGYLAQDWEALDTSSALVLGDLGDGHQLQFESGPWYGFGGWGAPPISVQITYVAGYANAALTAAAAAGATSLTVDSTLAVTTGQTLTIYDGLSQESVTVDPSGTISSTTIPLQSGTQFSHAVGVRVSAIPDAVTYACILGAAQIIKGRRAGGGTTMAGEIEPMDPQISNDMKFFRMLLQPFRRVV